MQRLSKILALMSAMIFLVTIAHGATVAGTVKGLPKDLADNPKYREGFGE